ncbi:MAG: hypothetical protein B1H03_02145 [Planctomycetales bacterium 4484_113]|nr:MAG: hypothetical protein B1H03_02145 [Planctomycetales bacterium 4484_113]
MRLMERIRKRFRAFLISFAIIFVISVFGGLGIGGYYMGMGARRGGVGAPAGAGGYRSLVPGVLAVARLGDRELPPAEFFRRVTEIRSILEDRGQSPGNDPISQLELQNAVLEQLFREEVLVRYARANGIRVSDAEVRKQINDILDRIAPQAEKEGHEKTIAGEIARSVKTSSERRKALADYLERLGTTRRQFSEQIGHELLLTKTQDAISDEEKVKAEKAAQEKVDKIKQALDAGEDFADVARKYSDDESSREKGGKVESFLKRGLLGNDVDKVAFSLKVGEVSDAIKTTFGYEFIKVLEKIEASGREFERQKPDIIKRLKERHQDEVDYEPTEEEIKNQYEKIKIAHIVVRNLYRSKAEARIQWMTEALEKTIYDPSLLAYRAFNQLPLYFPQVQETTMEDIARQALMKEGADLSVLPELAHNYLLNHVETLQKTYGDPPEELRDQFTALGLEPMSSTDEQSSGKQAESSVSAPVEAKEDSPADEETERLTIPAYPLAVGLMMEALKNQHSRSDLDYDAAYFYNEWLSNDAARSHFPVDPDAVRGEIERLLNEAISKYEYSAYYYALAGENYAAWVKPEQAREMLAKAETYAGRDADLLTQILSAYDENGDAEKSAELRKLVGEIRLEEQKQRAARMGQPRKLPNP